MNGETQASHSTAPFYASAEEVWESNPLLGPRQCEFVLAQLERLTALHLFRVTEFVD